MSDKTKAVNLTEDEVSYVLSKYGVKMAQQNFTDEDVDRINYLNKRLKAFKEPEEEKTVFDKAVERMPTTAEDDALNPANQQIKSDSSAAGWGTAENAKT